MSSLDDRLSELSGYTYRAVDGPRGHMDVPSAVAQSTPRATTVKENSSMRAIPLMLLLLAVICVVMLRKRREGGAPPRPAPATTPALPEEDEGDDDPLFQPL